MALHRRISQYQAHASCEANCGEEQHVIIEVEDPGLLNLKEYAGEYGKKGQRKEKDSCYLCIC
jgi:hypothetical protein